MIGLQAICARQEGRSMCGVGVPMKSSTFLSSTLSLEGSWLSPLFQLGFFFIGFALVVRNRKLFQGVAYCKVILGIRDFT